MAAAELDGEFDRAAEWAQRHSFQRIAVQVPDELLAGAARAVARLSKALPGRKVFLLGDSTYGSSSVDEVGAEHYGADCIVHVGASDQEHAGSMPVLFVFARTPVEPGSGVRAAAAAAREHAEAKAAQASVVLVCEVSLQHAAGKMAEDFAAELAGAGGGVFVAEPQAEAATRAGGSSGGAAQGKGQGCSQGGGCTSSLGTALAAASRWRDWRFGIVPVSSAWWTAAGPLALAAAARPEPLRICGREVRRRVAPEGGGREPAEGKGAGDAVRRLPAGCTIIFVGAADSPLERRLLLRHGQVQPVLRLEPDGSGVTRLSSDPLLLRRHRFVELVRSAGTIGLLLCATGASYSRPLADRLEFLLRRAGRRVYRFVIGRVTPEKLGNFREVECFVSLASPEHFPFEAREFHVPIASPYEVEVALGAREWTGAYIADLEELLLDPVPALAPSEDSLLVQTLGAGARVCKFGRQDGAGSSISHYAPAPAPGAAPALASVGLHGVAGRYTSEPTSAAA